MKKYILLALAFATNAYAQTTAENDFAALNRQRDAAIANAIEPIDQKFKVEAQKLLAKAIQSGNLEAAEKIKMDLLVIVPSKDDNKMEEVRKHLTSYTWTTWGEHYVFDKAGKFKSEKNWGSYSIEKNGTIRLLWGAGPNFTVITPNEDFTRMQEKGGGSNLFKRMEKDVSSSPGNTSNDTPFGRRNP